MKEDCLIPLEDRTLMPPKMSGSAEKSDLLNSKFEQKTLVDLIVQKASDLIWITTASIHPAYVYLNPSHQKILGYEPNDLIEKCPLDFIHPEDGEAFFDVLKSAVLSGAKHASLKQGEGSGQRVLYRMKDRSGHYRHLDTTVDLLEKGYLLFVSKDITEGMRGQERLREDCESLNRRVIDQNEEVANSKKVLKEEIFKRWRAEEALLDSERQNKTLLESFEDGYFEVDIAGNLSFFNDSLCRIVGYSNQEMLGMNNRQYMTPETSKKVYQTFNEVYRTGKATKAFGWELVRKDGQVRHVETSVSPVYGPGGNLTGFRGIARDVTERWSAEKALRESEEKYREIIGSIEDGYYEVDLRGNLVFFNDALAKILGFPPEEMTGMNNRRYMSEETAKTVYKASNEVYRTGKSTKAFDWEVITRDGEKRFLETSVSLLRDSMGKPIGFRGVARDVTERRLARKALEESEKKYRTILQSIEEGYYEVDVAGNLVFFNDSMCRILGYTPQEMKGMNNLQYMSEATAKTVYQTFNQVYRTGEPTKVLGWELICKDGQRKYVETSVSIARDRKGEPAGFRGIARDITEQKAIEKARERIINHLSHELGTPLAIIEGAFVRISDTLKKDETGKVGGWITRGQRSVQRLQNLRAKIDDILNERPSYEKERILPIIEGALSLLDELKDEPLKEGAETIRQGIVKRLESFYRVEETRKETIALATFLDEVCEEAVLSMKGRKMEIIRSFEKGVFLEMDRRTLKKACEGFLRNAIENTPDEGKIEIKTKSTDGTLRIDFQDFGIGILPENQKMIFGGFFHTQDTHLYASRKPYLFNAGGTGSDLLRTRVFSERFGFSIDFHSRRCRYLASDKHECPGTISSCPFIKSKDECLSSGGSTFSLIFPLKTFSAQQK
jgi:PAS domain S-box-containing protein